jgi:NTE family protein
MKETGKSIGLFLLMLTLGIQVFGQKVGLVLSGGGANALAHIGVLKALEENGIPIDYISGTSMGALVGGLYACGYSPEQIEAFITSESFKKQALGEIDVRNIYFFKRRTENASWITAKFSIDSLLETTLPTNLISPVPIDFTLMELTATATATANYNFDSLFVPFRCLASDIEEKQSYIFRSGDVGTAIRASMSYPFYLRPLMVNGKLLFDGGIYNNFPSNVMYEDFYPDIIIGSNVSANEPPPREDNLISQLKTMLLAKTNFDIICENGVIIEPNISQAGTFNFESIKEIIDSGYTATIRKLDELKFRIPRTLTKNEVEVQRKKFKEKQAPLVFSKVTVSGLRKNQAKYVQGHLSRRGKNMPVSKLKPLYFHLAEDEKIKSLYPTARYNKETGLFDLELNVKKERDITAQVGGNFSNRPINMGFLALQYNYLGRLGLSISGNLYTGKLYASAQGKVRIDFPFIIPFYIEPSYTYNRWDFFKSSSAFIGSEKPPFLVQYENFGDATLAFPLGNKAKISFNGTVGELINRYYQTSLFTEADTSDHTDFNFYALGMEYERGTINRKQYANQGSRILTKSKFIEGTETFYPGTTSLIPDTFVNFHTWVVQSVVFEQYFKTGIFYIPGIYLEGVFSSQSLFNNYTSSVLSSPAFQPTPETKTLFQERYRAQKYFAFGLRNIFVIKKIFELRFEAYYYQPYPQIIRLDDNKPGYADPFKRQYYITTGSVVAHTPIGPASLGVNYYHNEEVPFTFLFHFGYIIFNKKALE